MRILAIESSAKAASIAVLKDGFLEAFAYQNVGLTHSRTLMPMLQDTLKNSNLSLDQTDIIAASIGPGSFTGLRIGNAAAKGLVFATSKPCIGVSTLEAMAYNLIATPSIICCAMDARRSEIYNAFFLSQKGTIERLTEDRPIPIADTEEDLKNFGAKFPELPIFLVGDGAHLCYNHLSKDHKLHIAPPHLLYQNAYGVAHAASVNLSKGAHTGIDSLTPVYLRRSQAERERLEKGLQQNTEGK